MTSKKTIFLILALILPVAIFIFLKLFGRNEFNVPPRYQQEEIAAPANCDFQYPVPYSLPDSVFQELNLNRNDSPFMSSKHSFNTGP